MAALTTNKVRFQRNIHNKMLGSGTGADSSEFYEGGLVAHNNAGRIARGADTASFKTCGVISTRLTTGASNTLRVEFEFGHEEWFAINATDIDNTKIGLNAIISDDQTLTNAATAANDVPIGRVTELETKNGVSGAWVQVGVFAMTNA